MYFLSLEKISSSTIRVLWSRKQILASLSHSGGEALLVSLLSRLISALRRWEWSVEDPPEVVIVLTGLLKNVLAASLSSLYSVYLAGDGRRPLIVTESLTFTRGQGQLLLVWCHQPGDSPPAHSCSAS